MLKKENLELLKVLSSINSQMVVTYPVTNIKSNGIQAFMNFEESQEEPFEEFAIYDVNGFFSVLGAIDNADVVLDLPKIVVKNQRQKLEYQTADVDLLKQNIGINTGLIDRIKSNRKIVEFKFSEEDIKQIKKVSNLMSLETLKLDLLENKIILSNSEMSSSNFEIQEEFVKTDEAEESDLESIDFNVSMFQKVPNDNYIASVYVNKSGAKILVLNSAIIPQLDIIVMPK